MADDWRGNLKRLQEDFGRLSDRNPGLQHAMICTESSSTGSIGNYVESFGQPIAQLVADKRNVIDLKGVYRCCEDRWYTHSFFMADDQADTLALKQFNDLGLAAMRCLMQSMGQPIDNTHSQVGMDWPDWWLLNVYSKNVNPPNPLIPIKTHRLTIDEEEGYFGLGPGLRAKIPDGSLDGLRGDQKPWRQLYGDLQRSGLRVYELESNVFYASARAIDGFIRKDPPSASAPEVVPPLTETLKEVWELLEGYVGTAKEISSRLVELKKVDKRDRPSDSAIAKRIEKLNQIDRIIENKPGLGYYRPDAPPANWKTGHESD